MVCNVEYRVNDGTAEGAPAPAAVQDALPAAKWSWDAIWTISTAKERATW
jgi:hypothetical protein